MAYIERKKKTMTETQIIRKWLEKQNYAITTAHCPDKTIIFFYKHSIEKQAIYAIVKYENDNSFHLRNLFIKNKTAEIGLFSKLEIDEITENGLHEQLLNLKKAIDNEERDNFYDNSMHYPQTFDNTTSIINQYVSQNCYSES